MTNKRISILISFLFIFSLSILFTNQKASAAPVKYPNSSVKVYNGDILISKKSASGVTSMAGHAAMVTYYNNKAYVIHMPGIGKTIVKTTLSKWSKSYKEVKIVHHKNSKTRNAAASWMKKRYDNKKTRKTPYKLTSNNLGLSPSYCSKLVWQAYYYGADKDITQHFSQSMGYWIATSGYVTPYDLLTANDTKVVYKHW